MVTFLVNWSTEVEPADATVIKFHKGAPLEQVDESYGFSSKDYLLAVLREVNRLHDAGIVHNDIHYGNMLFEVNEKGDIPMLCCHLIDFGSAKDLQDPRNDYPDWLKLRLLEQDYDMLLDPFLDANQNSLEDKYDVIED